MKKIALLALLTTALGLVGCSLLVTVDRSKVDDDLYMPTPGLDAGSDASEPPPSSEEDGGAEEDAGT